MGTHLQSSSLNVVGLRPQSLPTSAHRLWRISVALALPVIVSGCPKPASVPPAAQDRPPIITITSSPSGGNVTPVTTSASGNVFVDYGTNVMVMGNAQNPGGVKAFGLKVTQGGAVLYSVQASGSPDAAGKVPDELFILGSDGAGNAGSKVVLLFTESQPPAMTEAWATNYNGMTTRVTLTYFCSGCRYYPIPTVIVGGTPGTPGTLGLKCGTGPPCGPGSTCCDGQCIVGQRCPPGQPSCSQIGQACVPSNQAGPHCCQSPASTVCNFQICRGCTPHGVVVPAFSSQICCDANDLAVLDPSSGQVVCGVPDCTGPDCPTSTHPARGGLMAMAFSPRQLLWNAIGPPDQASSSCGL